MNQARILLYLNKSTITLVIELGWCNVIFWLTSRIYLRFAQNVQRVHLITEEPAASRMLEPFGEVGGDVPECILFIANTFPKIEDKKVIAKN